MTLIPPFPAHMVAFLSRFLSHGASTSLPLLSRFPILAGSKEYRRLECEARSKLLAALHASAAEKGLHDVQRLTATERAAQELQALLKTQGDPNAVSFTPSGPIHDDDDAWMDMTPGQLDQLLQAYQAQAAAGEANEDNEDRMDSARGGGDRNGQPMAAEGAVQDGLQSIVAKMSAFVKGASGLEGVEPAAGPLDGDAGDVDVNGDAFLEALQRMLSGAAGHTEPDGSEGEEEEDEVSADEAEDGDDDLDWNLQGRGQEEREEVAGDKAAAAEVAAVDEQLRTELRESAVQSGLERVRQGLGLRERGE